MAATKVYTITEKQDVNSIRRPMINKAFRSLVAAKIAASRAQMFQGTILTIEVDGRLVSIKSNGKWDNC